MAITNQPSLRGKISANLAKVRKNIEDAARRSNRNPEDITLVAVTKGVGVESIRAAVECGVRAIGENRVQEAREKSAKLNMPVSWHFIGHLQKNKVKYIFGIFSIVHSVDSLGLAEEINKNAVKKCGAGEKFDILLQVNIGEEPAKHGIPPNLVLNEAERIAGLPNIRVKGLMAIPPWNEEREKSRPYYKRMLEIKNEIEEMKLDNVEMEMLSYGMSNDYTVAVEEGATHLRIGTEIFGERDYG